MWYSWLLVGTRDSELYMQMSRSLRGNDQKMTRSCTGSGIRSYRSSISWNGVVSAVIRAQISNKESGDRGEREADDEGEDEAPATIALLDDDDDPECIVR